MVRLMVPGKVATCVFVQEIIATPSLPPTTISWSGMIQKEHEPSMLVARQLQKLEMQKDMGPDTPCF